MSRRGLFKGLLSLRESTKKVVVHFFVVADSQGMKIGGHTPGSQSHNTNISSTELIAQGIGETLLAGFVGMIDRLSGEWGRFQCGD